VRDWKVVRHRPRRWTTEAALLFAIAGVFLAFAVALTALGIV
jgi:hypothetical protein